MIGTARRTNRTVSVLQIALLVFSFLVPLFQASPALAAGGAYTLKWYAADPATNRAPYLPTYKKTPPTQMACPAPSGGIGRAADPMKDAVAYGTAFTANDLDAVTSLAPKDLALGQIVPFEMEIKVSGSTSPENGVIRFSSGFNTHTTSGDNFGYDPAFLVYCAFVDTADKGTVDPGGNAKVDSWTTTVANPGGGANEEIQGTVQVSGLNSGDNVVVEIWAVLKSTIPAGASGNVQTRLIGAQTVATPTDAISTGNQTVPLLRVKEFFTSSADLSVTKSDAPDPAALGSQITYTIVAANNSPDTTANGVQVTDSLDPNTTFVSGTWQGGTCAATAGVVTCNVGALSPGQSVTITIVVTVKATAPTAGTTQSGTCSVGAPGVDLCNTVSVTAITTDPNMANNSASAPTDVLGAPALSLTKNATPTTYTAVDQIVSYSYELKNTGNVALSAPFAVTDDKAAVTCPTTPTSLAPGATLNCTASYKVTQADLDGGSVTNKATATAKFGDTTVTSNEATATVSAVRKPALSLSKSATPATYGKVGDVIAYSYQVKNTGNVTLSGPFSVADDKAADEACPATPASLAPGASINCTASYKITQADLDAGKVTNLATATNGAVTSNQATATVTAEQKANLTLTKSAAETSYSKVGEVIHYTLVATNNDGSNVTLSNVSISDPRLGALTCTPAQPATLAPKQTLTCTGSSTIQQSDLDAGQVDNTATASGSFGGQDYTATASASVPATQTPHLVLAKTATPHFSDPVKVGDSIDYQLVATNDGNVTLSNVSISDALLPDLTCTPAQPATLAPNATLTCSGSYALTQADIDAGKVANTAYATSKLPGGGDGPGGQDSKEVPVPQAPHLTLTKAGVLDMTMVSPPDRADAGDKINYTLTATNDGNQTLTGVSISDPKLGTLTCSPSQPATLAPGASLTCTGSYVLTQADVDAARWITPPLAPAIRRRRPTLPAMCQ